MRKKFDFANLTLVNGNILAAPSSQPIRAIAFFFDSNETLTRVMAVGDVETSDFNSEHVERDWVKSTY